MEDHILVEQRIMEALKVVIDGSVIKMLLNQMLEERGTTASSRRSTAPT